MKLKNSDEARMKVAITAAKRAGRVGEVPVGAAIFIGNELVATGRNMREANADALAHAELIAIARACRKLGRWRLSDCELYVTLEPCPMCAGAIINARIKRVVFGAYDKKAGSLGTLVDLNSIGYNHKADVTGGVLEDECAKLLSDFFKKLRARGTAVTDENTMG